MKRPTFEMFCKLNRGYDLRGRPDRCPGCGRENPRAKGLRLLAENESLRDS